jgi:hypothetical protein
MTRHLGLTVIIIALALTAGCGGGGSSSTSGSTSNGGSGQIIAAAANNVVAVTVDSGPAALPADDADVNTLFATITICAPGSTSNCQTIDHVMVDTGSYGLRILSSVLSASLSAALPQVNENSSGQPLAECEVFEDGYTWGSIKTADLQISGESVSGLELQIIGDLNYPDVPSDCANTGSSEDTLDTLYANGVLGIGPFAQDCGTFCTTGTQTANYYVCPSSTSCSDSTVSLAQQVMNPVVLFPTDNNGTIIELPSVPATGAATLSGSLVFGIGTEGNNGLGSAKVLTLDDEANLTTDFQGQSLTNSFFDTGSNGLFFNDSSITQCTDPDDVGFYCPGSTLSFSATNVGLNGVDSDVNFSIANSDDLSGTAFDDLGGPNTFPSSFDWGLPFFFGRNVYTAIDGQNTSGGAGPYNAY